MGKMNWELSEIKKVFINRKPGVLGQYGYFSVLVPLVVKDGEVHVLYEVRSDELRRQPGEVCFPGGKLEEGETEEACAVRETSEELGLDYDAINLIAQLDSIYTYSNFTMYSFLGVIDYEKLKRAKMNLAEVKEVFCIPLSLLLSEEPYIYKMDIIPDIRQDFPYNMVNFSSGYNWRKGRSEVPIYQYDGKTIWGLTARITHNLVKILREKG